jgi:hypothetical protein
MVITFKTMCQSKVALGTLKGLKHTAALHRRPRLRADCKFKVLFSLRCCVGLMTEAGPARLRLVAKSSKTKWR